MLTKKNRPTTMLVENDPSVIGRVVLTLEWETRKTPVTDRAARALTHYVAAIVELRSENTDWTVNIGVGAREANFIREAIEIDIFGARPAVMRRATEVLEEVKKFIEEIQN